MPRKVPRPRSVSRFFNPHLWKHAETCRKRLGNRRSRRCNQFCFNAGRIHRCVFQQLDGGRCRHRKRAMGTFHRAAADIQRRADDPGYTEGFGPHRGANDIHDGINRTHFVEVNGFDRDVMDSCLRRTKGFEDCDRSGLGRIRNGRRGNDLPNFA